MTPSPRAVLAALRRRLRRYRSAITGRYVSEEFAREHPDTTISELDKRSP
jgi:hypothetical protein